MPSNFEPIAIVGVAGLFPGASDLAGFWRNLVGRADAAREIPDGRWPRPPHDFYSPEIAKADRLYSTRACLLDSIPFDPAGLGLPADWCEGLDPVFRLTLDVGRRAWADSRAEAVDPRRVGVFLANIVLPTDTASAVTRELFGRMIRNGREGGTNPLPQGPLWSHPLNRYAAGAPAGLLARALGLGGGSFTLDAACASSLYSIKLACDELHAGRADAMIAGGVCRPESLYTQMGFSQLHALSPTGCPRPLDARADGIVVGEGAGLFVLKRLPDALAQGDRIHGVIRGVGLSNDTGGSLLAPDSEGQLRAMTAAYRRAGWRPSDVDLVECHATGTPLGDATELRSLLRLWSGEDAAPGACGLGSVKSNVGHLLTAAGAASLTKVLLGFANETLPPTANFEGTAPGALSVGAPFRVQSEAAPWALRDASTPRRAAVSAFGFGGINAHLLVEGWSEESAGRGHAPGVTPVPRAKADASRPPAVAIVGMDVRIGPFQGLREFQEAALDGAGGLRSCSASRWWGVGDETGDGDVDDAPQGRRGAWMDAVEVPVGRFRIPPRELEELLPQQILMLQAVDAALADAGGLSADPLRTGVFIGITLDMNTTNFYARWCLPADRPEAFAGSANGGGDSAARLLDEAGPALSANRVLGALGGMTASRIARELRTGGPSFTISAEETSGVRALEAAMRALQSGEIDAAVVGAVDLGGDLRAVLAAEGVRPMSPEGDVRPLAERASGSAVGEGAVALILRRTEDAEHEGRRIYAMLEGVAFATGGAPTDVSPSSEACERAMRAAHAEAGIEPSRLGLLEVWGSGVGEEDARETAALARLFDDAPAHCALAGLHAVTGHAGAAAGLASIARAALCLHQEILPRSRGMFEPAEALRRIGSPFFTSRTPQYWFRDRATGPRHAAATCMSLDGNASHVVLSGYESRDESEAGLAADDPARIQPAGAPAEALFAAEADTPADLALRLDELRGFIARGDSPEGGGLHTLAARWWRQGRARRSAALGLAFVARDAAELVEQIGTARRFLESDSPRRLEESLPAKDRIFHNPSPLRPLGEVAFVFPGSGNQYVGMGAELGARWPQLLRRLDRRYEYLASQFAPRVFSPYRIDWSEGWEAGAQAEIIRDHRSLIFGHVSHSAFLSDVARQFALEPSAVIGYSLGETAGYFALRAWTDRDEMMRRVQSTTLFTEDLVGPCRSARAFWGMREDEPLEWRVGVVDRSAVDVRAVLKSVERAYLLIVNTPQECVIGGEAGAVGEAVRRLGCSFFPLQGISTVHCEVAKPVRDAYRGLHLFRTTPPPGVRFYSGAFGRSFDLGRQSAADSIVGQAITGFDFPRTIESAYEDGVRVFLEMGPQASCSRMISRILGSRPHVARSICLQGQSGYSGVLRFLARLISERIPVDLAPLYDAAPEAPVEIRTPARIRLKLGGALNEPPELIPAVEPEPRPEAATPAAVPVPAELAASAPSELEGSDGAAVPEPAKLMPPSMPAPRTEFPAPRAIPVQPAPAGFSDELVASMAEAQQARAAAHAAFLRLSQASIETQSRALTLQMSILGSAGAGEGSTALLPSPPAPQPRRAAAPASPTTEPSTPIPPDHTPRSFDRARCMEFARGKIVNVLGPDFASVDLHPTRVRLPDEPLMLVDRITEVEGEPRSLGPGRLVTEHDVLENGWYLDGGRMAPGVTIEAGQADLFLSAYLGIDFETQGIGKYRLLDAAVTYHRGLPRPGETIRYDIRIERFSRQGSIYIFFFNYDGFIGGEKLMTMRQGCAGFFSDRQLDEGRGLVLSEFERMAQPGKAPADWSPPVPLRAEAYDGAALAALRAGDLPRCFGPEFGHARVVRPYTLPTGPLELIDRVTAVEPAGGRYGLGFVRAEKDIDPQAWFLTCHFVDDPVMPGTLMYESSLQALRVLLLRMGWIGEEGRVVYEPRPGVNSRLRCRGQVKPGARTAAYEVSLREIGFDPEPYAIADTIMYADGRPIVLVSDISIQLTGLTRADIDAVWSAPPSAAAAPAAVPSTEPAPVSARDGVPTGPAPALVGRDRILSYTNGSLVHAFGERYRPFDEGRFIARLPQEPFLFLDRITRIESPQWELVPGGEIETQFDVPPDAWFFAANRQPSLPFSVLLEYPLQSCGWFSAWMGSALRSGEELHYRNLGGKATLFEDLGRDAGTLTARIRTINLSSSAGMLIQSFAMTVYREGRRVYEGDTSFGFFSKTALSQQVGVRGAKPYVPAREELDRGFGSDLKGGEPATPQAAALMPYSAPGMPATAYRMIDRIEDFIPDGGLHGLGFIRGGKPVNPADWFFRAHFFQDPVWPGSLGLEAFLQLLKFVAYHHWGARIAEGMHFEPIAVGIEHTWIYRGQVIPRNRQVTVEAVITRLDPDGLLVQGDGFLKVDGLVIYEMKNFAVRAVPDAQPA